MGEEAFRGVAICCFCCPVVGTVGSFSHAHSFELEQRHFCLCMCETQREVDTENSHRLNSSSLCFLMFCLYTVYNSDHLALSNELAVQRNQCYSVYFPLIVNVACVIHIDFCLCCQVPILLMGYHSGCVMEDSCYKMT